jgi:hypothetical protein
MAILCAVQYGGFCNAVCKFVASAQRSRDAHPEQNEGLADDVTAMADCGRCTTKMRSGWPMQKRAHQ